MGRKESDQVGESVGAGVAPPFKSDAWSRTLSEEVALEKYLEKVGQGATWKLGSGDAQPGHTARAKAPE